MLNSMKKISLILIGALALGLVAIQVFVPERQPAPPPTTSVEVTLQQIYTQSLHGVVPGDSDRAVFRFCVSVAPTGGDIYLDGDPAAGPSASGGIVWSFGPESKPNLLTVDGAVVTAAGPLFSADYPSPPGRRHLLIRDGDSRTFAITVSVSALADRAAAGIRLDAIHWRDSPDSQTARRVALDPDEFSTQTVALFTR
jgi:hypothetical protein